MSVYKHTVTFGAISWKKNCILYIGKQGGPCMQCIYVCITVHLSSYSPTSPDNKNETFKNA
jgi:hypothetical protein